MTLVHPAVLVPARSRRGAAGQTHVWSLTRSSRSHTRWQAAATGTSALLTLKLVEISATL